MAKAEYRSAIRSKTLIKKAVAQLLQQKELSRITVSDIIREADISRGTFYAHYPDVYGVVTQIVEEELHSLVAFVDEVGIKFAETQTEQFITEVCAYLEKDREYYKFLAHTDLLDDFIKRLFSIYYEPLLTDILAQEKCKDANEANIYLLYLTSGVRNVLLGWLNQDLRGTPEEIGHILGSFIRLTSKYYE
ncbi:MAG: TetR/AcrR family transcriptional regulator C-terminal domain-containing protein [Clostridia bacterium]|nr:TetR/AcrR family transcriptional regulator C-terminal domain-containing protein [Clostridia bacterium]